jgi:hypothetical protein
MNGTVKVYCEAELYEVFWAWLDSHGAITIPAVGGMEKQILSLSDVLCDGQTGFIVDEMFEEWKKENYHYIVGWIKKGD